MVEGQCGFRKGRSCTDAIFTVQQIIEKRKEHSLPLFLLFIDYEKAYDNVKRDKLWEMMDDKIPNYLLNTIKWIYRNTKVRIKFDHYMGRTAQLTSRCCILYIYSTNIRTEYFKHAA